MPHALSSGMPEKILSPAAINRKAEYRKHGRYADGGGLYLQVTPKADGQGITRAWLFQYSWNGKVRQMGLGSFANVSLAQARKRAEAARDKVADGIDPIAEKNAERRAAAVEAVLPQTFEAFATEYITTHSPSWRNEIHRKQWTSTLKAYAYPIIGKTNVADIETSDVLRVLKPIWASKLETADRVRGRREGPACRQSRQAPHRRQSGHLSACSIRPASIARADMRRMDAGPIGVARPRDLLFPPRFADTSSRRAKICAGIVRPRALAS